VNGVALLDAVLDRTVVVGYTSVGYRMREHSWKASDLARMDGRVVLVTGATSGIGRAAAEGFAALGASVRMLARDARRGEQVRAEIAAWSDNDDIEVDVCDLSDLASVRRFTEQFTARGSRLDVLVNNAGVLTGERGTSADGIELTLATNVLGPFLLTNTLAESLAHGAPGRIVNVSSGGMYTQRLHLDDLQMTDEPFDGSIAYARSKRIQVILTELWAERFKDAGAIVHAMHPGWVDTPGLAASLPRFRRLTRPLLRTPSQGADTIVWLGVASEPARSSGGFWHDRRPRPTHRVPWTRETDDDRRRLWTECERLSGRGATARRGALRAR
jgi:NAD(P)-dependent dehydrogenase (short-subunit alcohol dehydrogenase family)